MSKLGKTIQIRASVCTFSVKLEKLSFHVAHLPRTGRNNVKGMQSYCFIKYMQYLWRSWQPRSQDLLFPTPKGARVERTWFRLVTCLGNKFIFEGGVPIYQSIVAAAVYYLLNGLSGQLLKVLFRFRGEDLSYQVHCFQLQHL